VIGVTGHHDIASGSQAQLKAAFGAILDDLGKRYARTPLVVMTSLAPGAEMLAAETAVERALPLIAALPEPAEELERSLTSDLDRERFRRLLAYCSRVTGTPERTTAAQQRFEIAMSVAHCSNLVVAFWDGERAPDPDGLIDIVDVRLTGACSQRAAMTDIPYLPEVGPVFQVVTPRAGATEPAEAFAVKQLYPADVAGGDARRQFAAALACLDVYNADLAAGGGDPGFTPSMRGLQNRTDMTADRLQRTTYGFLLFLYAVAIVATALQYVTNQLVKYVALGAAFVVYRIAHSKDYENRFQDYRVISEGLRVQVAWKSAGLSDEVERCYLGRQEGDLQWIRMVLRYAYFAFEDEVVAVAGVSSAGTREWIEDQCRFFSKAPKKQARSLGNIHRVTRGFFLVAVATTIVTAAMLYIPALPALLAHAPASIGGVGVRDAVLSWWSLVPAQVRWLEAIDAQNRTLLLRLSTAALTMYAAAAFLVSNYCDKRAFKQNIKRYDRMIVVFERAKKRLADMGQAANSPAGERIVRELGEEALIENADWLLNRRERPFSFVS
jgi:hypothetical protein